MHPSTHPCNHHSFFHPFILPSIHLYILPSNQPSLILPSIYPSFHPSILPTNHNSSFYPFSTLPFILIHSSSLLSICQLLHPSPRLLILHTFIPPFPKSFIQKPILFPTVHPSIHPSFHTDHLLRVCHVPGPGLGAGDTEINKTSPLLELTALRKGE